MKSTQQELTIIQKTYDLIPWFVPIIERFPRFFKFGLGANLQNRMYAILEELITAKYEKSKEKNNNHQLL